MHIKLELWEAFPMSMCVYDKDENEIKSQFH